MAALRAAHEERPGPSHAGKVALFRPVKHTSGMLGVLGLPVSCIQVAPLHPGWHHIRRCPSAACFDCQTRPSGLMSLQGCAQDVDRYSPAWWYADVPESAIIPLRKLEAVLPYLRQVDIILRICDMILALSLASPLAASHATEL